MGQLQHGVIIDYDYLPYAFTIKQNHNVIDYDHIVSNHDYNCLETSSERKQNPFAQFYAGIFSDNIPHESMQQTKLLTFKDQAPEKRNKILIVY